MARRGSSGSDCMLQKFSAFTLFLYLGYGRLVADWSVENVTSDLTLPRMWLNVGEQLAKDPTIL